MPDTSTTCIYCGSCGPFSDEHAIPHLLGEFTNFPLLTEHVCTRCNGAIGKAENQLAYCGPEALIRRIVGIGGRKGHSEVPIDIFQRGSLGVGPLEFERVHPETGIPVLWTIDPGT
jgi:hypothetical protein